MICGGQVGYWQPLVLPQYFLQGKINGGHGV